jgi:hypothetical protein
VLRAGWGTPNETALWLLDGDFYQDHRHYDQGAIALYALGVPLSLNWGSLYQPHTGGAFLHSVVLPESQTGHPWDQSDVPLEAGSFWRSSTPESFLAFRTVSRASARFQAADGTTWVRTLWLFHPEAERPIILIQDHLSGAGADAARVFSLNLMAQGDVATPAGKVTPPLPGGQLPSAGTVFPLKAGVNRLGFTGQLGVDWDLYTLAATDQQAHVGNWGHNWHPEQEKSEFARSLQREFEERQHILRVRGTGPLQVLLLPYPRGKARATEVKQQGDQLVIAAGKTVTILGPTSYAFNGPNHKVLASFRTGRAESGELAVSGPPTEVVVDAQRATITAHGAKGVRRIQLPGKWRVDDPQAAAAGLALVEGQWQFDYPGGAPRTVTLRRE